MGVIFGAIGRAITGKYYIRNTLYTTIIQLALWIYLMVMVFVQQRNVLSPVWGWLSLFCYSAYSFMYGFVDTINYLKVSHYVPKIPELIEKGSSLVGVANQVGAVIGSVASFFLALYVFHS